MGGFQFVGVLFVEVAHGDDFFLAVEGIGVEVELGVERLDVAVALEDQRVDFRQRGIGFHVAGVQFFEYIHRLRPGSLGNADAFGQGQRLCVGHADQRVDEDLDDLLRGLVGDFLDVHAAFGRGHHRHRLRGAIGQRGTVIFVADVGAFLDQQVTDLLAGRAGLVRDQLHAENLVRVLAHLLERFRYLDTTALATAAGVNLGLDHPDTAAQGFRCLDRVIDGRAVDPARNRNAEFLQDLLTLIFVNFHALSLRLVELRAMGGTLEIPAFPPGKYRDSA